MGVKTAEELQGYDYDWLACDRDGRIAIFSTAGGGYTPEAVLANTHEYDEAIDALLNRQAHTTATMAEAVGEGIINPWQTYAERGLFSYDSDYSGRPYRLVGVPLAPLMSSELEPSIEEVARRVELKGIELGKDLVITAADIVRSERSE